MARIKWVSLIDAVATLSLLGLILAILSANTDRMNTILNGGWVQGAGRF